METFLKLEKKKQKHFKQKILLHLQPSERIQQREVGVHCLMNAPTIRSYYL